jgi:RND family efflux transporter MFP subunit
MRLFVVEKFFGAINALMHSSTTKSSNVTWDGTSRSTGSTVCGSSGSYFLSFFARARTSPAKLAGASLALAAVAAGVTWAATRTVRDTVAGAPLRERRVVRVAPVSIVVEGQELRLPGTTRAVERANLSFVVAGRLAERPVDLGDRVEQGDLLAGLDPHPFLNEVRSAEAALAEVSARLEQTKRDCRRLTRLHAEGIASQRSLEEAVTAEDQLRASFDLAKSRLREARRAFDEATLVAPFDGTVTRVHLEPGEFAREGATIVTLSGDGGLEIEVELPESAASTLAEGQEAQVRFPLAEGRAVRARLKSVSRGTGGPGRLFPIVAELDPTPGVIPGMIGELLVHASGGARLAVPLASIIDPSGKHPYVFRVRDGSVQRVPVEVRTLVGDRVTVSAPLEADDSIVTDGHLVLLDGDPVQID